MKHNLITKIAVAAALVFGAGGAMATACDGTNSLSGYVAGSGADATNLQKEDLTLNSVVATNCYGHADVGTSNDPNTVVGFANTNNLFGTSDWFKAARANTANEDGPATYEGFSYGGLSFSVSNLTSGVSGSFTLNITDLFPLASPNLPAVMDLFITTKSSTLTDFFFFDNISVSFANSGTYSVAIQNNNGKYRDLSDITVGVRDIRDTVRPPQEVPEPASLALVGLALAGLAVARRRSK